MGDVLSLIEKAGEAVEEEDARKAAESLRKGRFTFNDYLDSMKQVNKLGGMGSVISMLGMGGKGLPEVDESMLKRNEAIIMSMTPAERDDPKLLNPKRKMRIAKGSGVDIMYVNRLVKQFEQMSKMMKQMTGGGKKRGRFGQMAQMKNLMGQLKI